MIELDAGIISKLESYRGTLAYVAVLMRGEGTWPTAHLASAVNCQTSTMREGLEELSRVHPEALRRKSTNWVVGSGKASEEAVQILESEASRRQDLLDDLKVFVEWAQKRPFEMGAADGKAIAEFLKVNKTWTREDWKAAMRHRAKSEVNLFLPVSKWIRRLPEYLAAPLDRYGKPMLHGGGASGKAIGVEIANSEARAAAVAAVHG